MTPEEAHKEAATSFYNRLLADSKQLDNMRHYCNEMSIKLPCDFDPRFTAVASKDLRRRYGLNYNDNNVVWAILEDWFKNKIDPDEEYKKSVEARAKELGI